jgi:phosphate transport system substrate-binding protein
MILRITSRRTASAVALVTVLALFAAACGSSKSSTSSTATTAGASSSFDYSKLSGTLNGSGSTFQKGFDEAAIAGFADVAPDVTVNYGGGGSGKGKTDLATQVVQWAGTDSLIKDADLPTFKGGAVLYFPTVAAPITVSYNLSAVKELRLSPSTLAKIFGAKITSWNDAAIAADNPDATLPDTPIVVAHRSDGSGTTSSFTNYLKAAGGPRARRRATATPASPRSSRTRLVASATSTSRTPKPLGSRSRRSRTRRATSSSRRSKPRQPRSRAPT